jgi:hypothetical protein
MRPATRTPLLRSPGLRQRPAGVAKFKNFETLKARYRPKADLARRRSPSGDLRD